MYIYEALLKEESAGYSIEIPDFCASFSTKGNRREAIVSAVEQLKILIRSNVSLGHNLPEPQEIVCTDHGTEAIVLAIEVAPPLEGFVTVEEAMSILSVSQPRIAHLLRDGKLKAIAHGRRKLITKESLEAYMVTPRTSGRPKKAYDYAVLNLDPGTEEKS